jgi:uncharacterized protein DUF4230
MRTLRLFLYAVIAVALVTALLVLILSTRGVDMTESQVRTVVVDTFLRERPESFVVTGTITFTTSVIQESEKTLLPGILNLDLGTTVATVRAPGRAVYGFDAGVLGTADISLNGDTVTVRLPALQIFAVEPDLERLEQRVEVGWARMYRTSGQDLALQAVRALQPAMRQRAAEYLASSEYPAEHSARAVEILLTPALNAAGLQHPVFVIEQRPTVLGPSG